MPTQARRRERSATGHTSLSPIKKLKLKSSQREPRLFVEISIVFKRIRGEQTNKMTVEYHDGQTIRAATGRARGRLKKGGRCVLDPRTSGRGTRSRSHSRLSQSRPIEDTRMAEVLRVIPSRVPSELQLRWPLVISRFPLSPLALTQTR